MHFILVFVTSKNINSYLSGILKAICQVAWMRKNNIKMNKLECVNGLLFIMNWILDS